MTITIKNTRIHQRAQQVSQYWSQIDKAAVVRGTGIIIIVTQWLRNRQDGSVASELRNRQNYWRFRSCKIAEPSWRFCLLLMLLVSRFRWNIEWDLANRFRRRTLILILTLTLTLTLELTATLTLFSAVTGTKLLKENKSDKNDTEI